MFIHHRSQNAYDMLMGIKGLSDFSREFYEFTIPAIDMFEGDDTNELIVKNRSARLYEERYQVKY